MLKTSSRDNFRRLCSSFLIVNLLFLCPFAPAALAQSATPIAGTTEEFSKQYSDLTKELLLNGIELERFSLNYRLESARQPKFRRLRYFLSQETAAAGILAFEIVGDQQFGRGKNGLLAVSPKDVAGRLRQAVALLQAKAGSNSTPLLLDPKSLNGSVPTPLKLAVGNHLKTVGGSLLTISPNALKGATATVTTTSIIGGAGSCLELASNALLAIKNKKRGFDPHSANKFVADKLKQIDAILAKRNALVQAHSDYPGYARAVLEGKILQELRNAFVEEYSTFHADARQFAALTNMYYFLNACTYALGATGGGLAYKAVKQPTLNGPANILFIVTGAMFMATPIVATLTGKIVRKQAYDSFCKQIGEKPDYDPTELTADRAKFEQLLAQAKEGNLIPELPGVDRAAIYTDSQDRFTAQLKSETAIIGHLDKVAFQSSLFGPIIGSTLMTQGIIGTNGYYKYTYNPKKQFADYYAGAVVGTVGGGLAVVATTASLLAEWSYENKLRKQNRMPSQLIEERLKHLDELEKSVRAI